MLREMLAPDELRDLARREPLCAERRALLASRTRRCGWWPPTATGSRWRSGTLAATGRAGTGIVPRKAVQEIARPGRRRGGPDRDQRQPVHAADAELRADGAADRRDSSRTTSRWCRRRIPQLVIARGRAHRGAASRLGDGRGAEQAGEADPGPGGCSSSPQQPGLGEAEEKMDASSPGKRSRSASTRATSSTRSARARRAGCDRVEGRIEPRSGQKRDG